MFVTHLSILVCICNNKFMLLWLKRISIFLLTLFILYSLYLASIYVLNGEVHLTNDIGRDFLLLQELDQKKIVLIGPRTNIQGVFHGVLWTYLNYPAYLLGQGNPVTVGWFWVILTILFVISSYFIFSKLFGRFIALLGALLLSLLAVPLTNNLFGQLMNFYLMPVFIYTLYRYFQKKEVKYLFFHVVVLGFIIQFNIGVGGLIACLSTIFIIGFIFKNKLWKHSFSFLILPILLFNFIIFDLRHNFSMAKALIGLGGASKFIIPLDEWMINRIYHTISMQLFLNVNNLLLLAVIFVSILVLTILEIRKQRQRTLLFIVLFYYIGYLTLTYFNKGILLIDHVILLAPLSVLWLLTLAKGTYKYILIPLLVLIILIHFNIVKGFASVNKQGNLGTSPDSWLALQQVAKKVVNGQKGKAFGYFVYSPDAYAYQQRYAMMYYFKNSKARSYEYSKLPTTYIIIAPPPPDKPYMTHEWWVKNKARIAGEPIEKDTFPRGYKLERYSLSREEQKIPHVPDIELGIHFR